MLSDEKRAALIQMCREAGVMVQLDSKFGRSEYTSVQSSWPALEKLATAVAEAAVKDAVGGDEPVAYQHELQGDGQTIYLRWSEELDKFPFGRPGLEYSEEYKVVTTPLYTRPQASAAVPGGGFVLVPKDFVCGVLRLAHNCSMKAVAPFHYSDMQGDAFSEAYARCGKDLSDLRAMLAASQPEVK